MERFKPFILFLMYLLLIGFLTEVIYLAAVDTQSHGDVYTLILSPTGYGEPEGLSIWEQISFRVQAQPFNLIALCVFVMAVTHTFFAHKANVISNWIVDRNEKKYGYRVETFGSEMMRFMGEIEVVFGVWVIPLMALMAYHYDWNTAIHYLNNRDYTEPMFVVMIMVLASTKPILHLAEYFMRLIAKLFKETVLSWWWILLTVGPFLGSLITEPGAMTISALLISKQFYRYQPRPIFVYATLGLLFTNISVGGVFTSFAAPPVLMVSKAWGWDTPYMFMNFGIKAVLGILVANLVYYLIFKKDFKELDKKRKKQLELEPLTHETEEHIPFWISIIHLAFLAWIVVHAHHPVICVGSFLLFLGFYQATLPYQNKLSLRSSILVGFFLAGLVVHGTLQAWWISPILTRASESGLMVLSTILTAFNDNAEITFLASLIPDFSEGMKYAVVAGAVTGGGLTVIANAPNPAGQSILSKHFDQGVSAVFLFLGALTPTIIIGLSFFLLHK